jgi:hypothetical protein
MAGFWIFF